MAETEVGRKQVGRRPIVKHPIWNRRKASARSSFKQHVTNLKRRYVGAARRRHTAAVKRSWKSGIGEDIQALIEHLREMQNP